MDIFLNSVELEDPFIGDTGVLSGDPLSLRLELDLDIEGDVKLLVLKLEPEFGLTRFRAEGDRGEFVELM